ncbi:hypothetical protein GCM10010464_49670 [Pseudonocardia yunnanensis]
MVEHPRGDRLRRRNRPGQPHDVLPVGVEQMIYAGFTPLESMASATSVTEEEANDAGPRSDGRPKPQA